MTAKLFTPLTIRGVTIPNRIVVSPMDMYRAENGHPQAFHHVHYGRFALGGAGMVMVEATGVTPGGRITNGCLGIWNDAQAQELGKIAGFLRAEGTVPAIQLAHGGRKAATQRAWQGNGPLTPDDIARGEAAWETLAPSALPFTDGWIKPREMTRDDMDDVRDAFVMAAKRALDAGFAVLEIHMAHGYLLQSFLSPLANQRSDEYGGSLENRMRFPVEVAAAVRAAIPDDVPLFARISATDWIEGGFTPDESVPLAAALKSAGVDVVDCSSGGNMVAGATNASITRGPAYQAPFAARIRAEAGMMTQAVGMIRTPELAEELLNNHSADLIAIGRQMLYDPNWPRHAAVRLGYDPDLQGWNPAYSWWLSKWAKGLRSGGEEPEA
ncbi:MAG: NADH:flavin oxidoreductase/NADH oxidase [Paracoccaceae bacterium]